MVSRNLYTYMSLLVHPLSPLIFIQTWLTYITFRDMSYQVTKGSGYVTITLLVMGQVSVEFTVVVDMTGGTATGE